MNKIIYPAMDEKREKQIANLPQEITTKSSETIKDAGTSQTKSTLQNDSETAASGDTLDAGDWV